MSIGALQNEADLKRFIERLLQTPGAVPFPAFPFKNGKVGVVTLTWTGSQASAVSSVDHGLGVEPVGVLLTPRSASIGVMIGWTTEETDALFKVQAWSVGGAVSGTTDFTWLAVA